MKNFADRLDQRVRETGNPSVMGIDPLFEYVPESILNRYRSEVENPMEAAAMAFTEFGYRLMDSVKGIIPVIKPQLAFFELLGDHGIRAFINLVRYARNEGFLVIADAKRGDILSTATAYAKAYLGETQLAQGVRCAAYDADAVTVNPYLGFDGIKPFIDECEAYGKGIFVLVRTSNPSAVDFQDLRTEEGNFIYEKVADKVSNWGETTIGKSGFSSVGAVVGATWPKQARELRKRMSNTIILVPGYGAQGAKGDTAALCFDDHGRGAIVNASRSLMCAYRQTGYSHEDFQEATYREAIRMRDDLRNAIEQKDKMHK
jgi:orotidine-5'-phosphate decarboxylase